MVEQKRVPPDREIVERFVEHLRNHGHPDLTIDSWPEDDHPGQSVVEAIAGNLAIEHTSVDTLPDQRRIGEQFMDALGVLDHLPATARLSINVPYELVTVGTDWEAYRLALAHWILNVAPTLPDGRYDIELPNTPLTCIGIKESDRPARVVISRPIQDDETLSQRVAQQITRKMKKLRRYKADGYATVLILETHDQSLMNQHKMLEAVREGLGGLMPEGLDQLWFTEARGAYFFDFAKPIRDEGKAEMKALDARRKELRAQLENADDPPPLLHPEMAELYRQKVTTLAQALEHPETRTEATEALRGLIDAIVMMPADGALRIELKGSLAAMLGATVQNKRAPETEALSLQVSMVAGARSTRSHHALSAICQPNG